LTSEGNAVKTAPRSLPSALQKEIRMALSANIQTFWSTRTCINRAIYNVKMLMNSNTIDSVTKESLLLEFNTLKNIQVRMGKLEKWMNLIDGVEE